MTKSQARQSFQQVRKTLSPQERSAKSLAATGIAFAKLKSYPLVAVYSAFRTELDCAPLVGALRNCNVRIAFPVVPKASPVLSFYEATDQQLRPGHWGILEPDASATPLSLANIDAFVVPGLGFDACGNRLGWGKGFYDHTLAKVPDALRVGLCFQEQIATSIPCEQSDQSMDWVVTDEKFYKGKARRSTLSR